MSYTDIQWTDMVWNPVTGCSKVSQGCKFCYAERVFPRAYGKDRKFTDVQCHPERLDQPLHWKKPRRIFVNSMSDLFHDDVPDEFIDKLFTVMALAEWHTFQVLTKRGKRMREYCSALTPDRLNIDQPTWLRLPTRRTYPRWFALPLHNVGMGVSCEDQPTADERFPLLLQTPAAVRFVSLEPLLGPIDLNLWRQGHFHGERALDWVICGGESGPHARPMEEEWAQSLMQQCKAAGLPFFMKQGSKANWPDFKNFESFPKDLQIREFPQNGHGDF